MGGGGGGGSTQRSFGSEWPSIKAFEKGQFQQIGKFVQSQPLLKGAESAIMDWIMPILQGGGTSPQLTRQAQQDARNAFAARGNYGGNQAVAGEILNTEQARFGRFGQALGMTLGTQHEAVSEFAQVVDPVLQYLSTLFAGNQAAAVQESIANQGKTSGIAGGALSAVGSIASKALPLIFASDERLKEKIRDTGMKTAEGIPIKTYRWKGDPKKRTMIGVTAQDVEKKRPDAVFTHPAGFKMIDFASIRAPNFALEGS